MEQASGATPDPGGPPDPNVAAGGTPAGPSVPSPASPPAPASGTGLQMEPCYRHPAQFTGVHCTRCGRPICVDCMRPAAVGYQCPDCLASERSSGYKYQRGVQSSLASTPVTRGIMFVTAAVFLVELAVGASQVLGLGGNGYRLVQMGAALGVQTAGVAHLLPGSRLAIGSFAPELWRLVTPMFLHLGLIHIGFNMYALAILGPPIEREYGPWRFLALYLGTGILGNVASFVFGPSEVLGAGASTAVFGLFGIWLVYNYRRRGRSGLYQANLRAILITLALNFVLNIGLNGVIDWRGHLGGFLGGIALGYAVDGVGEGGTRSASKVLGFVVVFAIAALLVAMRIAHLRAQFGVA